MKACTLNFKGKRQREISVNANRFMAKFHIKFALNENKRNDKRDIREEMYNIVCR